MKYIITITTLLFYNTAFSQAPTNATKDSVLKEVLGDNCYCSTPGSCNGNDKNKYYYTGKQYITNYSMNRLIRKEITKITLDEDGLPALGNYATSKIAEDKSTITFNASVYNPWNKKDTTANNVPIKNILSINVKAGINEGVSSLFTNKNINNEATVKLRYTVLKKSTLFENDSILDCNKLKLFRNRLLYEYEVAYQRYALQLSMYDRELQEYIKKAVELRNKRDQLSKEHTCLLMEFPEKTTEIAELKKNLDSAVFNYLNLQDKFNTFQAAKPKYDTSTVVDSFYKRLLALETAEVKWTRYRMQWWDFTGELGGKKYNLFDNKLPVDSQLSKKNFTSWSFGVSFNSFSSKPSIPFFNHGIFLKIGYQISNDNSLSGEDTKEIITTNNIDTPNFRRQKLSKVNAYDIPFTKSFAHTFKSQVSKYLNEKKTNALSLYTTCVLSFNDLKKPLEIDGKPKLTAGIGYLFGFLDKEKEKNTVNFEVFLNFTDILNAAGKETKFFERHDLGIKFGVPFNSIFLNQK